MSILTETAEVAWGYTMADIDRLAQAAERLARRFGSYALNQTDREETAWHGVAKALFTLNSPTDADLIHAGAQAVRDDAAAYLRLYGVARDGGRGPHFALYWLPPRKSLADDGFSDHFCELASLPSALATLTPTEYEALITLAAFDGDTDMAARALGVNVPALHARVNRARKRFKAAWFDGETPPAERGTSDACRAGHLRAEHGFKNKAGTWCCRPCLRKSQREFARKKREERRALREVA
jgi:hypothetical protein